MATTFEPYTGNNSTTTFAFNHPSYQESDIKVTVDGAPYTNTGVTGGSPGATTFTIPNYTTSSAGNIVFNTAPGSGAVIRIFRDTNVDVAKATFQAGSSVKAADLNNTVKQLLYAAQEEQNQLEQTADIQDSAITSAKIKNDTIVDADIKSDAAIAGTKVNPDFGSQNITTTGNATADRLTLRRLQLDVTGTGTITTTAGDINLNSNGGTVRVQDNLYVQHATDIDGNLNVDGTTTLDGTTVDGVLDVNGSATIDNISINNNTITTTAGNLGIDSAGGSVQITDNTTVDGTFSVTGNVTLGDSTSDTVAINGLVNSHLLPAAGADRLIGMETVRWSKVYADEVYTDAIRLDDATGKLQIGFNPDLELYHNNTDGYIDNNKGHLYIRNNVNDDDGGDIYIQPKAGENGILIADDGGVGLYTDNVLKFSTSAAYNVSSTDLVPNNDSDRDLGGAALKWQNIWVNNIRGGALVTSGTSTSDIKSYSAKRSDELYYRKGTADDIEASGVPWSGNDSTVATTAAIDKRIVDIVDDVGGFVPLTDEGEIPQLHPEYQNTDTADRVGTILSIGVIDKSGGYTTANGRRSGTTVTIAAGDLTNHAVNATITNCNVDLAEGFGVLVETTAQTDAQYAAGPTFKFHRLVPKATEVTTVAGIQPAISNVSSNFNTISNVNSNLTSGANISNVNSNMGIISTVNTNIGNNVLPNINTNIGNNVLPTINTNIGNGVLTTINTNIGNNVLPNINTQISNGNIAAVAGKATEIGVLAASDVVADMAILGASGVVGNIATVAGQISPTNNINTVATNIADVNNFADRYQIASSNPSTDGGGNALAAGDLYFNTSANELKVYNGSAWQGGVTATGNFAVVTGNTFTGNNTYNDNVKAIFGAGSDLEIFHNGNDSVIKDGGTGSLNLRASALVVQNDTGTENIIRGFRNGAAELWYDHSKKLETTSTGVSVTGALDSTGILSITANAPTLSFNETDSSNDYLIKCQSGVFKIKGGGTDRLRVNIDGNVEIPNDSGKLLLGAGNDLQLYHNGTNSYIDNNAGSLIIDGGIHTQFTNVHGEDTAKFLANGAVELYYDNSRKLKTEANGVRIYDNLGIGTGSTTNASISIRTPDGTSGSPSTKSGLRIREGAFSDGKLIDFQNSLGNTDISVDGSLNLNFADGHKIQLGDSQDLQLYHDGSNSYIDETGTGGLYIRVAGTANNGFYKYASNEPLATFQPDNAVSLYYDNSKKLETTSTGVSVTGAITSTGSLTVSSVTPQIFLTDTNNDSDFKVYVENGTFHIMDVTNNDNRFRIESDGDFDLKGNVRIPLDDKKLQIGASQDLEILHGASNSLISNKTGTLLIRSDNLDLRPNTNSAEVYLRGTQNAGVELRYDNSKKLETTSGGVKVTGNLEADRVFVGDNETIRVGGSADLMLLHDANGSDHGVAGSSYIKCQGVHDNILNIFTASNSGKIHLKSNNLNKTMLSANGDGSVDLYHNNSKKLETASTGIDVTGKITATGNIESNADNSELRCGANGDFKISHTGSLNLLRGDFPTVFRNGANNETLAKFTPNGDAELYYDNSLKFETTANGVKLIGTQHDLQGVVKFDNMTNSGMDLRWEPSSNSLDFEDNVKARFGTGDDLQIYHDSSNSYIDNHTGTLFIRGGTGTTIKLQPVDGEDGVLVGHNSTTELFYDNVKRFATTTTGGIFYNSSGTASVRLHGYGQTSGAARFGDILMNQNMTIRTVYADHLIFNTNQTDRAYFHATDGHFLPNINNTYDLGSSSQRWANVYTQDLQLSNEAVGDNGIDGTWGNYTIVEGESDLFLKNNRSGKTYKFNLTEVV